MKRKVYLFLAMVLCFFTLTACGETKKDSASYDATVVEQVAREAVEQWNQEAASDIEKVATDEAAAEYKENIIAMYEAYGMSMTEEQEASIDNMIAALQGWNATLKEVGDFKSVDAAAAEFSDAENAKFVNVKLQATCEKGKMYVTVPVIRTAKLGAEGMQFNMLGLKLEEIKTLGQKMSKAGLNTLMGIGLVFVLLVVICLLISCFGIFGTIGKKKEEPQEKKKEEAPLPVIQRAARPVVETEEVTDDTELVAVITAAIMASMGEEAPADGLVVRSIRRRRA